MKLSRNLAFRRGFAAGFSSPYKLIHGGRNRTVRVPRNLVSLSWEKVGRAVSDAIESERHSIGKDTEPHTTTGG